MKDLLQAPDFDPKELLLVLSKNHGFSSYYDANVGIQIPFTLRAHTLAVMQSYEKYFGSTPMPGNIDKGLFRLMLALHDIGKPDALKEGDKRRQHVHTQRIFNQFKSAIPYKESEIDLIMALNNGDPFGSYLRGFIDERIAKDQILAMHKQCQVTLDIFFDLLTIYYQADTSAYTSEFGMVSALDHLYEWKVPQADILFEVTKNRLVFSREVNEKFDLLECSIKQAP